jgi:hypothetical protein
MPARRIPVHNWRAVSAARIPGVPAQQRRGNTGLRPIASAKQHRSKRGLRPAGLRPAAGPVDNRLCQISTAKKIDAKNMSERRLVRITYRPQLSNKKRLETNNAN